MDMPVWRESKALWASALVGLLLAIVLCWAGVTLMVDYWLDREEYSHGILIPFIALYLIWQKRIELSQLPSTGTWAGFAFVLFSLAVFYAGELSALYTIIQYAFLLLLYGLALSLLGWRAFAVVAIPLLVLSFMIPLPNFLYNNLSAKLQLLSSEIGVSVIRAFGISVFLEGNVIDLGTYKLQVVEACNGLRYLFPLMTLGFIVAYLYQAALWKRAVIFLSTMPITVLMNSFRIGVIGVMVDRWGQSMAEGFLHDFEGWVIFMACFGVLFIEMWLLMRITGDRRPLREVFGAADPRPTAGCSGEFRQSRKLPASFVASVGILALAISAGAVLPERVEIAQPRREFIDFPLTLGKWRGRSEVMETVYVDALKFTDYVLGNYQDDAGHTVNFYSAYYASQRKGESVHSPRSCLPGGGWEIQSLSQRDIPGVKVSGVPLRVNRALISYGDQKQLVYYWFQQRGRVMTNEYLVKWNMLVDAITRNRTDGALVRLISPIRDGQNMAELDAALGDFSARISGLLPSYIPD